MFCGKTREPSTDRLAVKLSIFFDVDTSNNLSIAYTQDNVRRLGRMITDEAHLYKRVGGAMQAVTKA